jgi:nucleotide-binding universal stress UspA family protein
MGHMIVVGFDGSDCAERALRWASAEAQLRNTQLRVLHGWQILQMAPLALRAGGWAGYVPPMDELQRAAQDHLEQQVAAALPGERAHVQCEAVHEHPVKLLVAASREAELLVVGSRGLGPARSLVLGSVSLACIHQAQCPVVVVRT